LFKAQTPGIVKLLFYMFMAYQSLRFQRTFLTGIDPNLLKCLNKLYALCLDRLPTPTFSGMAGFSQGEEWLTKAMIDIKFQSWSLMVQPNHFAD
jgi:hypothetical protein